MAWAGEESVLCLLNLSWPILPFQVCGIMVAVRGLSGNAFIRVRPAMCRLTVEHTSLLMERFHERESRPHAPGFGSVLQKVYLDLEQQLYMRSEIGVSSAMCEGSGGTDFLISYTFNWDWFPWEVQGQRVHFV